MFVVWMAMVIGRETGEKKKENQTIALPCISLRCGVSFNIPTMRCAYCDADGQGNAAAVNSDRCIHMSHDILCRGKRCRTK